MTTLLALRQSSEQPSSRASGGLAGLREVGGWSLPHIHNAFYFHNGFAFVALVEIKPPLGHMYSVCRKLEAGFVDHSKALVSWPWNP